VLADPLAPTPAARAGEVAGDDAALLRRTRRRLIAWSGGLTLLILLALGALVYGAVANELEGRGTAVLERRAIEVSRVIGRRGPLPDRPPLGLTFGGEQSGTLTLAIAPDGSVLGRLDESRDRRPSAGRARWPAPGDQIGERRSGSTRRPSSGWMASMSSR
jgi:hypothetical protein